MIRINLLNPEMGSVRESVQTAEKVQKEKKPLPLQYIGPLIVALICLFMFFNVKTGLSKQKDELEAAKLEKQKYQDVSELLTQLEAQKLTFERKIGLIEELKQRQQAAVIILDELSKNLPEWVWLTEADYKDGTVRLKGKALTNNLIADYIYTFEENTFFSDVGNVKSEMKRTRDFQYFEFSLTARFNLPTGPAPADAQVGTGERP